MLLTLSDAIKVIRRYKWLIVAATVLAGGFGYLSSARQTKIYQASITVLVGQNQGLATNLDLTTALQDIANSMSKMMTSRTVAEKVVGDLHLSESPDAVMSNLTAVPVQQTQLINVSYTDPNPQKAAQIANGVGNAFAELISKTESSSSGLTAQVWQGAAVPSSSIKPTPTRNGILAALLGLAIGAGLAFMLDRMDTRWRSMDEVEDHLGLPILGIIPQMTRETLGNTPRY